MRIPPKKIISLVGTRPEIIKMSPVLPLLDEKFDHILVHSGQHYSENMDSVFFDELDLRRPDVHLKVGSHSPGVQTGKILSRFEKCLLDDFPDAVVVQGDTNTTLAGALASAKYKARGVSTIHLEAGMRSHNHLQTEEINRRIVDQVSDLLLVPDEMDARNLVREGISESKVVITGSTVIDSCMRMKEILGKEEICTTYGLDKDQYIVATFHRHVV